MKFILVSVFFLVCIAGFAQQSIIGEWEGTLTGTNISLIFHVKDVGGRLETKMDSPSQGAFQIPCTSTTFSNDSLNIKLDPLKAFYNGRLDKDNQKVQGSWHQAGQIIELILTKKKR